MVQHLQILTFSRLPHLTPVSGKRYCYFTSRYPLVFNFNLVKCGSFGGSLLWGFIGRIDQTVSVRGRLVPSGNVREVDAQSGGVVAEVLVTEGQL